MKNSNSPVALLRNIMKGLVGKLTQHPEFYNVRHYTKSRGRRRNRQINF